MQICGAVNIVFKLNYKSEWNDGANSRGCSESQQLERKEPSVWERKRFTQLVNWCFAFNRIAHPENFHLIIQPLNVSNYNYTLFLCVWNKPTELWYIYLGTRIISWCFCLYLMTRHHRTHTIMSRVMCK